MENKNSESKTFIIATIGPASHTKEILTELIKSHMNMVRFNFSWGNYEEYSHYIELIREISKNLNIDVKIIQDLSGPRVQTGSEHHFGGNKEIITKKDIEDLKFGVEHNFDYIAMSFVGKGSDIVELRDLIKKFGGDQKIIAKVERKEAVDNIDSIIEESDIIMVARGDLGNEFSLEEIPFVQHQIIKKSIAGRKTVIVATQMLESMVDNKVPTRAEVSDVAYAVLDGANGVMLSEESARGKFPVEAVKMMEKIILVAEKNKKNHIVIG